MFKQKTKAFTLVELIVVITILSILGTIAFISMQGYSKSSRDSVRISDVSTMKTSLELFHLNAGKYPLPDDLQEVVYDNELLWSQGTFGKVVTQTLSRNLNETPSDPLLGREYVYSVANNKNEFEILSLLESDVLGLNALSQTNAANIEVIPRISGTYKGIFIKTSKYIVPVPSIINSNTFSGTLILDGTNIKSQIIDGGENIPKIGNVLSNTGGLDVTLSVYTGSITSDSSDIEKENVMKAIQGAYTGSVLKDNGVYKVILGTTGTSELASLVDVVVLSNSPGVIVVEPKADCLTSTGYVYNTHDYEIPEMSDGDSTTVTSTGVLENSGTFTYDLTLSCEDGNYISKTESDSTINSCDEGYNNTGTCSLITSFSGTGPSACPYGVYKTGDYWNTPLINWCNLGPNNDKTLVSGSNRTDTGHLHNVTAGSQLSFNFIISE